jgi:predicted enzyme related to lactoylglutathione lyase
LSCIGGVFFCAHDPDALRSWYAEHLGVELQAFGSSLFEGGQTVWSIFADDTDYFGSSGQQSMINYRVSDLDAMLAELREAGASVEAQIEESEFGRFGWATDPEGNRSSSGSRPRTSPYARGCWSTRRIHSSTRG